MITKIDVTKLLNDLNDEHSEAFIKELYSTPLIPSHIIKYLNDRRSFDISKFYEKLRYNYNHKKSDLYINIVKEVDNVEEVLTTLAAYNLQVLLFAKNVQDKEMFYKNSRVQEVTEVLSKYYKTFDIDSCIKLLSLIKADIKLFEELRKDKVKEESVA